MAGPSSLCGCPNERMYASGRIMPLVQCLSHHRTTGLLPRRVLGLGQSSAFGRTFPKSACHRETHRVCYFRLFASSMPFRFGHEFSKRGSVFAASVLEGVAASGAFDLCIEIEMLG